MILTDLRQEGRKATTEAWSKLLAEQVVKESFFTQYLQQPEDKYATQVMGEFNKVSDYTAPKKPLSQDPPKESIRWDF